MSYATTHARQRLKDRWGLKLTDRQWQKIAESAADGAYEMGPDWVGDAVEPLLLVPIGQLSGAMYFIPMIIDLNVKRVITVHPPERNRG